jgi:hypothetical protein
MLLNLAVFVASAGIAAGIANMVWRMMTHEGTQHHPGE